MDIERSFSSQNQKLQRELHTISENSNVDRYRLVSEVAEEFNKISADNYTLSMQKHQTGLNHNFDGVEEFQAQLHEMAKRLLYRENILANYVWQFYRKQKSKLAFGELKRYCEWKRYCKRCINVANKKFRASKLRRVLDAWRDVKYKQKTEKYSYTFTAKCSIETEELKRIQANLTNQLHKTLSVKNEELTTEEANLAHLKERFDTLNRTGTPIVLREQQMQQNNNYYQGPPQNHGQTFNQQTNYDNRYENYGRRAPGPGGN